MKNLFLRMIHILTGTMVLSISHCVIMELFLGADFNNFVYSLVYLPIIILFSSAEKKVKHSWQYLGCVTVVLAMIYFMNLSGFLKGVILMLTFVAAVSYFIARAYKMKCWLEQPGFPGLIIFLIIYFLSLQADSELLRRYAMIGAGIYYLLCIYQLNMEEVQKFIWVNEKLERVPVHRIYHGNYLMLGIQTVFVTSGMCLFSVFQLEDTFSKLGKIFQSMIRWLFRWLESDEIPTAAEEAAEQAEVVLPGQAEEVSDFMKMLHEIMDKIAWVIVIAVTLYVLYRILKKLYQLYMDFDASSEEVGDKIEQIKSLSKEDEKSKLKKQKTPKLFWDRTPNARIRKYYKKRVLKELKAAPKISMTPEEIGREMNISTEEKELLRTYYEKARYGNLECTKEEVLFFVD